MRNHIFYFGGTAPGLAYQSAQPSGVVRLHRGNGGADHVQPTAATRRLPGAANHSRLAQLLRNNLRLGPSRGGDAGTGRGRGAGIAADGSPLRALAEPARSATARYDATGEECAAGYHRSGESGCWPLRFGGSRGACRIFPRRPASSRCGFFLESGLAQTAAFGRGHQSGGLC